MLPMIMPMMFYDSCVMLLVEREVIFFVVDATFVRFSLWAQPSREVGAI